MSELTSWKTCHISQNKEDLQLIKDLRQIIKEKDQEIDGLKKTVNELMELLKQKDN